MLRWLLQRLPLEQFSIQLLITAKSAWLDASRLTKALEKLLRNNSGLHEHKTNDGEGRDVCGLYNTIGMKDVIHTAERHQHKCSEAPPRKRNSLPDSVFEMKDGGDEPYQDLHLKEIEILGNDIGLGEQSQ